MRGKALTLAAFATVTVAATTATTAAAAFAFAAILATILSGAFGMSIAFAVGLGFAFLSHGLAGGLGGSFGVSLASGLATPTAATTAAATAVGAVVIAIAVLCGVAGLTRFTRFARLAVRIGLQLVFQFFLFLGDQILFLGLFGRDGLCGEFDRRDGRRRAGALDLVVRHDQVGLGLDLDGDAVAALDLGQLGALAVEDVDGDLGRNAQQQVRGAGLDGLFLKRTQHVERGRLDGADEARAVAVRADMGGRFQNTRAQALARHFHEAEVGDAAHLDAGAVVLQRFLQATLDIADVVLVLHVDEVDDDEAGHVAQAELAGDLVGGLKVGLVGRLFDVVLFGRPAGVDVDGHQRLGRVDDDVATRAQLHDGAVHVLKLRFHLIAMEEGHAVAVQVHLLGVAGHQQAHVVLGGAIAEIALHPDFIHIARVDVADGALDEAAVLVDQRRGDGVQRLLADLVPQAGEIVEVALDLGLGALEARRADDAAHALRQLQLRHDGLQATAVGLAGNLPGDAAAVGGVGHQDRIAASQRQVGGERRALAAALFLHDLNQKDLAALDDFLNLVAATQGRAPTTHVFLGVVLMVVVAGGSANLGGLAAFARLGAFAVSGFGVLAVVAVGLVALAVFVLIVGGDAIGVFVAAGGELFPKQGFAILVRDLVVVGVDFAEGQETVTIAAVFDECGLEGGFYPGNPCEIDIAFKLLLGRCFKIKFFNAGTTHHGHPGFLRVAGVDQHTCGHSKFSMRAAGRARESARHSRLRVSEGTAGRKRGAA